MTHTVSMNLASDGAGRPGGVEWEKSMLAELALDFCVVRVILEF